MCSPRGETGFEQWMKKLKRSVTLRLEQEEVTAAEKEQQEQRAAPPMLKRSNGKSKDRVIRDISEVHRIFAFFDEDQSGTIEPREFLPLLAKLMRQPVSEMDKDEVWRSWDLVDADGSGQISLDEFTTWYCATFGIASIPDQTYFINEDIIPEDVRQVRQIAKRVGMDYVEIEKMWKEFSDLDKDNSGYLDCKEFEVLIQRQLAPGSNAPEVPPKVLERFWNDIDADGSGAVNFEEFTTWYMKFFFGSVSPMEQYYQMLGSGYRGSVAVA